MVLMVVENLHGAVVLGYPMWMCHMLISLLVTVKVADLFMVDRGTTSTT